MQISSVRWGNPEHTQVVVVCVNGETVFCEWPSLTWHREFIDAWLDIEGNEIEAHEES